MAPINLSHRRTHNLLLISKLLSLRDTASPLTLLLDSLEQPATPLIKEYIRRAKVGVLLCKPCLFYFVNHLQQLSKVHVTFIAFETLKRPDGVDAFISARRKSTVDIAKEAAAAYPASSGSSPRRKYTVYTPSSEHARELYSLIIRTPHHY